VDDQAGEVDDQAGDPVGEDRPGTDPVVAVPGEVVEPAVEPVDPASARIAELVSAAHVEGRPVGRRTVARELGVTEYRAGQLLARTNTNGMGGTRDEHRTAR